MDEQREIIVTNKCEVCEAHHSDLSILKSLEETVKKNFPDWDIAHQADLIVMWFEKTWKEEMALQIQKSKKENMKDFRKDK